MPDNFSIVFLLGKIHLSQVLSTLIGDNVDILQQLDRLLANISVDLYCQTQPQLNSSSIGVHLRHVLDHYTCLLEGLDDGLVDYDQRARDARIEESIHQAQICLKGVVSGLQGLLLKRFEGEIQVYMATSSGRVGNGDRLSVAQVSSLERELGFLHSHTVHHNSSIALLLKLNNVEVLIEKDFGLAPATAHFQGQV